MDKENDADERFKELNIANNRSTLLNRVREYSRLTLPYICPPQALNLGQDLQNTSDSIGAAAVNHLSNKLVTALFPATQPFFRLRVGAEEMQILKQAADAGDQDANAILKQLDTVLTETERSMLDELSFNKFRTEATTAIKHLIITGNACMYVPEGSQNDVQVYGITSYVNVRDLSGRIVEAITLDTKAFATFAPKVQEALRKDSECLKGEKDIESKNINLYTWIKMELDGKYHVTQWAEDVKLDTQATYAVDDLPWLFLTWNLIRGEDYGRSYVEDYHAAFHSLDVLSGSMVELVGIASDIKWLVNPESQLDVVELNNSKRGSYHVGKEGDLTAAQLNKSSDFQVVMSYYQDVIKQIARAFLMNSMLTRDAERVTATEIRDNILELETALGGQYSRFSEDWQMRLATLLIKRTKTIDRKFKISPQIITGMDSLSRSGELDNLRMMLSDLNMFNGIPESLQQVLDWSGIVKYIGIRRGIDYTQLIKSQQQVAAEQQALQQQQAQEAQLQTNGAIAEQVAKKSME
jgi:hypothetical protein